MFAIAIRFYTCLIFLGKARSLQLERGTIGGSTLVGPSLACKYKTRLERLGRDKHSSLLQKFVNCGRKKFFRIGTWPYSKIHAGTNTLAYSSESSVTKK